MLFYAADDDAAGDLVAELIRTAGYEPVRVGGLDQSIRIEMFGDLHEFGGLGRVVTRRRRSRRSNLVMIVWALWEGGEGVDLETTRPPGTGAAARRERWARLRRTLWRRDAQPRRPRPRRLNPRRPGLGPVSWHRGRAGRDEAARREPARLGPRPGLYRPFAAVRGLVWLASAAVPHARPRRPSASRTFSCSDPLVTRRARRLFHPRRVGGARREPRSPSPRRCCSGRCSPFLWLLAARGDRPDTAGRTGCSSPAPTACDRPDWPPPHLLPAPQRPHPGLGPDRRRLPGRIRRRCSSPPARRRRRPR